MQFVFVQIVEYFHKDIRLPSPGPPHGLRWPNCCTYICPYLKMHLSKMHLVFAQVVQYFQKDPRLPPHGLRWPNHCTYICPNLKMYLSKMQLVFAQVTQVVSKVFAQRTKVSPSLSPTSSSRSHVAQSLPEYWLVQT